MNIRRVSGLHRRLARRRFMRDESGVIAIIVALSMSTFLLGFAALAVDLGTAYVRKAELKSLAEKVAIAGATGLPAISEGVASALGALGSSGSPGTGLCKDLDLPGVCTAPAGWAQDGADANGEITFFADEGQTGELADRNGDGVLNTLDKVPTGASQAVGIRVLLPPSQVPFGLASALGFDSASLQQTATARIGTPLGAGILPFGLSPADLAVGDFCVQDPTVIGLPVTAPAPVGSVVLTLSAYTVDAGQKITVFLTPPTANYKNVQIFLSNDPATPILSTQVGNGAYEITMPPPDNPGDQLAVWATGKVNLGLGPKFISSSAIVTYTGTPPTGIPCDLPAANRGFLKIARSAGGDTLEPNIRVGPEPKLYPTGGLLGTLGTALGCVSTVLNSAATTCLTTVLSEPFATRMTDGFFTSAGGKTGRLIGDCSGDTYSPHGFGPVDSSTLLDTASPWVDTSFGPVSQLRADILSGVTPTGKEGWIRSQAFKCPRLAVMPVLDPAPLTSVVNGHNIIKLTYVWIDDDGSTRGLRWVGNTLRSFRGYVVDPKYLAEVVAGSPVVGPYLGANMPKEALLIPNLASP